MGIGTAVGVGSIVAGGLGATSSIIGANKQSNAAENAQELQAQEAQNALNEQHNEFQTTQTNAAPFLQAGQQAVGQLSGLTSTPGQGLLANYSGQFTAPTAAQAAATPGYQFTLGQGLQSLDRGAAAKGSLLTGGTGEAEQQYGQNLASTTYQQSFNNALTQYQQAYNQFNQGQANTYNRLAGLAGSGQTAAQTLGQQGQQAASNASNIYLTTGAQQGQDLNNAAAATASGYVGAGNALGGVANSLGQYALLSNLLNSSGGSGGGVDWGQMGSVTP